MQKNLQKLLDQEVSRKDFLVMVGAAAMSVFGVSRIYKNASKSIGNDPINKPNFDYGDALYGGKDNTGKNNG